MELDNCVEFQIRVRWSDISSALPDGSKSVLSGTKSMNWTYSKSIRIFVKYNNNYLK
jgi:hypothetical protein